MNHQQLNTNSGLFFLVDNTAALVAAERLETQTKSGLRFCCEHREKLTVTQGRERDQADAIRKARFQHSMAELEGKIAAAEQAEQMISAAKITSASSNDDSADEFEPTSDDDSLPDDLLAALEAGESDSDEMMIDESVVFAY